MLLVRLCKFLTKVADVVGKGCVSCWEENGISNSKFELKNSIICLQFWKNELDIFPIRTRADCNWQFQQIAETFEILRKPFQFPAKISYSSQFALRSRNTWNWRAKRRCGRWTVFLQKIWNRTRKLWKWNWEWSPWQRRFKTRTRTNLWRFPMEKCFLKDGKRRNILSADFFLVAHQNTRNLFGRTENSPRKFRTRGKRITFHIGGLTIPTCTIT